MSRAHVLPAEIAVLSGRFGPFPAAQPLVFAHLADVAPSLDLGHVEVVPVAQGAARLAGYFEPGQVAQLQAAADGDDTLVLVLPAAFEGLEAPMQGSGRLRPLGAFRGRLRRSFGADP